MAQQVKNPAVTQEMQVRSLGQEDPPEEGLAIHSSIPAWRIPWTEEPGGLQATGLQRAGHDWASKYISHSSLLFQKVSPSSHKLIQGLEKNTAQRPVNKRSESLAAVDTNLWKVFFFNENFLTT